jgi:hypothetical protein
LKSHEEGETKQDKFVTDSHVIIFPEVGIKISEVLLSKESTSQWDQC